MDNKKQLEILLKALDWSADLVLKSARANSPAITAQQFLAALIDNKTVVATSKALGCGSQTLNRLIDKHLVPRFGKLNGGNETWLYKLRTLAKIKRCYSCEKLLNHSEFGLDKQNSDGLNDRCKYCRAANRNVNYFDLYYQNNKPAYRANSAKRKAAKLLATPAWSDKEKIKKIYEECPVGYHVDHIYPLQSDWVCGLHTVENLQYLSAEENLSKGNRYIEEIHGGVVKLANTFGLSPNASA